MGTLGAGPGPQVSRELGYTFQPVLPAGFSPEAAGTAAQMSFMSEASIGWGPLPRKCCFLFPLCMLGWGRRGSFWGACAFSH